MKKKLSMILIMLLLAAMLPYTAAKAKSVSDYTDVSSGAWYYQYIAHVSEGGLMTGTGNTTFAPEATLVRAQFATVLYRMSGAPSVDFSVKFTDVPEGQFFSLPVTWANNHGIVTGYSNSNSFGSNDPINREQLATMLYRYANYLDWDTSARADISGFPDCGNVTSFAYDAMGWAVASGMIKGDNGYLNPQGTVNRAVCATMIARFTGYQEPSEPTTPVAPTTPVSSTVYWTANGEVYHSTMNCPSLSRSKNIYSGTIAQSGKSRPCKNCY